MTPGSVRRSLLIGSILLVQAVVLRAGGNVRILDVGFHGLCPAERPCPIVVALSNPIPRPQDFELQIGVRCKLGDCSSDPERTYLHRLTLGPLEERQIEAILQPVWSDGVVEVAGRTSQGGLAGYDYRNYKKDWVGSTWGVGVVCDEDSVCKSVQSQIQLSGSGIDRDWKTKNLQLVTPLPPRSAWWWYDVFAAIVVAVPPGHLNSTQRSALEWYARSGGTLILLRDSFGDPQFLAEYRGNPVGPLGTPIGTGLLYDLPSARSLEAMFGGPAVYRWLRGRSAYWRTPGPGRLQAEFGTIFIFPDLVEVLIGLSIYILVVGVGNFAWLRSWRGLEWGWLTVAGVALVFVVLLYGYGSVYRPDHVTAEGVAIHYLDTKSGRAASDYGLHISVPDRQKIVLRTASDTVLLRESRYGDGFTHSLPSPWEGRNFTRGSYEDTPLGRDPLPEGEIALTMPRWTSQDLYFRGIHSFAGTVHETAPGHFRSDTGQQFFSAAFLDGGRNRLWLLGEVAAGAEIDLARARSVMPWGPDYRADGERPMPPELAGNGSVMARLVWDQIHGADPSYLTVRRFYGLTRGAAQPAEVRASGKVQREQALLVVIFP